MPEPATAAAHAGIAVQTQVIIIGSGFSGLGLAVALKRSGFVDFLVLERANDVGGTWRDNTYPGAACDIQSHLYSYSFRPNPNWSRVYAPQPEIWAYLRDTARDEEIYPHLRFGENVVAANWNPAASEWAVETTEGNYRCRALVSAAGHLSDPSYPDIPGIESFRGRLFHSARWDHSFDPVGTRMGVIGTGASAIQIVPAMQPWVSELTVFQRTAPYVIPRLDHEYTPAERGMFARLPSSAQGLRDDLFWGNESRFPQRRQVPVFIEMIKTAARDHLNSQVEDPKLRSKLTPDYTIGCKRILISSDYYPALQQPNVTLEGSGIAEVDESGVITRGGDHVDLDILVVATGFEATELPIADVIHGRGGLPLARRWQDGGEAFACATISGFPNLFVMLGPNTGLGAGSIIFMVETQINYIREALAYILENDVTIEPEPRAEAEYVQSIHTRSEGTVWVDGGCDSWYLHAKSGKLTALWPDFMFKFRQENGSFSPVGYRVLDTAKTPA